MSVTARTHLNERALGEFQGKATVAWHGSDKARAKQAK